LLPHSELGYACAHFCAHPWSQPVRNGHTRWGLTCARFWPENHSVALGCNRCPRRCCNFEPGGRRFESCRARHLTDFIPESTSWGFRPNPSGAVRHPQFWRGTQRGTRKAWHPSVAPRVRSMRPLPLLRPSISAWQSAGQDRSRGRPAWQCAWRSEASPRRPSVKSRFAQGRAPIYLAEGARTQADRQRI